MKLVGVRGIAPPRLTVSETGLSAVRGEPHAVKSKIVNLKSQMKVALPAGLSPATATFEASRSDTLSYGSREVGVMDYWSGGLMKPSNLQQSNHPLLHYSIPKLVGRLGFAPSSRRLRAGTSLSKFATRNRRDAKVELNHRSQICEVLTGTGISRRGKRQRTEVRDQKSANYRSRTTFLTSDFRPLTSETGRA